MRALLACLLLAAPASAVHAPPQPKKLPKWAQQLYQKKLSDRYELACLPRFRPCVLEADFEGDGKPDAATMVRKRTTGALGVAVFLSSGAWQLLGAGTDAGGGADWSWVEQWKVFKKGAVKQGPGAEKPPVLSGDAILVEKRKGQAGLVYCDAKKCAWYPLKEEPKPEPAKAAPTPQPQTQP